MQITDIDRRRLGERVYEILSSQIIDGRFPSGSHLSELNLCNQLGVSRTPVREALFKLEEKGLVVSRPNRGFFVPPLDRKLVEDNYPILAALDALALRMSPPFSQGELKGLRSINRKLRDAADDPALLYQIDLDFHDRLTRNCPNQRLLSVIEGLKFETRQRDGGFKRGIADRDRAFRQHEEIISILQSGDNRTAGSALEEHWLGGVDVVTAWIDRQTGASQHGNRRTA